MTAKKILPHYVYYLYTCDLKNELVEVGRSKWPHRRRLIKERKHRCKLRMLTSDPILDFGEACQYEVDEIRALKPRFNKLIQSSPGSTGKPVNLGCKRSPETRARMSRAKKGCVGRVPTAEECLNMSARFKGKPLTANHRKKIGDAQRGELNHMFGKKRTLEARKQTSESLRCTWAQRKAAKPTK